jgi:hypothetical protein
MRTTATRLASPDRFFQPRKTDSMQHIHIASKSYRLPHEPKFVVLVLPHGAQHGNYFEVNSVGLELLRRGWTPEKIGLDPIEEDE